MTGNDNFLQAAEAAIEALDLDELERIADDQAAEPWKAEMLRAVAALHRTNIAEARDHAMASHEARPQSQEVVRTLATIHALAGDLHGSTYFRKLESTQQEDPQMSRLLEKAVPAFSETFLGIEDKVLLRRGRIAYAAGDYEKAEHWFRQHTAFFPTDGNAHLGLGLSLVSAKHYRGAAEALSGARHLLPTDPAIASLLGHAMSLLGEVELSRASHRWAMDCAPDNAEIAANALTDALQDADRDSASLAADFANWGKAFGLQADPIAVSAKADKPRLTIAYLVGSIGISPAGTALADILARHDPRRYRVIGLGMGALSDSHNSIFQKCFDEWHDTLPFDAYALRTVLVNEEVDIFVDVAGFAQPNLLRALSTRTVPCQVAWGGAPLGTGLAGIDALLVDPLDEAAVPSPADCVEPLVALESGTQLVSVPWMEPRAANPARNEFIIATDARLSDLTPTRIAWWAHALTEIPDSILLIRDHGFKTDANVDRMISQFGAFGISHKVDVVSDADHFDFLAEADLVLPPVGLASPQLVIDALSVGTPVICSQGTGRHERTSANLLTRLGLADDMVARDPAELRRLTRRWVEDPGRREATRTELPGKLSGADFLDPGLRARELEETYQSLWKTAAERFSTEVN